MAGTILISEGCGVPMSSLSFDYMAEEIRKRVSEQDLPLIKAIYEPYDEEGMMFVSLMEASSAEFQAFCRASLLAKAELYTEHQNSVRRLWDELIEKLISDPRYTG